MTHLGGRASVVGVVLCVRIFALSFSAEAQQPKKVFRIGYLSGVGPARESARAEAFRTALHELGYIEGQNIAIEYRYAEGKNGRLPGLAAELVYLKVDIIVGPSGSAPIQAAKNATQTIPIVMMSLAADPVQRALLKALPVPAAM